MHKRHLGIYLNDHLALLTAGRELARRSRGSNEGGAYGPLLARVASDFEEDRILLESLMSAHGVTADRLKSGFAWAGEKLGRLKLNGSLTGYSPLSRVVELNGLTAIITLLEGTWAALEPLLAADAEQLQAARGRARRNLDELNSTRPRAVAEALAGG